MPALNPNVRAPLEYHEPRVRPGRLLFRRALVALAACAVACGGALPPKRTEVAGRPNAGGANTSVVDAEPARDASPDATAARSCAVKTASLASTMDDGQHQCLEGMAPRASDLQITFTPRTPTVSPGGRLVLDLRITNVSDHTVSVRTELPRTEHLSVITEKGVAIAPPAGPMPIRLNPNCGAMTCSHVTIPRGAVVALLPGGVIADSVVWQASEVAWPPPRLQDCLASCMGTDEVVPIALEPLAAGKYRVQTALRVWSQPEWITAGGGADLLVR